MTSSTCSATTNDGKPCPAPAVGDSGFCLFHDPNRREEAKIARLRGGLNRKSVLKGEYPGDIATVPDLLLFLNKSLQECWQLESGEKRLTTIASFLRIACDILSLSDLDGRLQILENLFYKQGLNGTNKATKKSN
jgi:hypothetical protein